MAPVLEDAEGTRWLSSATSSKGALACETCETAHSSAWPLASSLSVISGPECISAAASAWTPSGPSDAMSARDRGGGGRVPSRRACATPPDTAQQSSPQVWEGACRDRNAFLLEPHGTRRMHVRAGPPLGRYSTVRYTRPSHPTPITACVGVRGALPPGKKLSVRTTTEPAAGLFGPAAQIRGQHVADPTCAELRERVHAVALRSIATCVPGVRALSRVLNHYGAMN